MNHKGGELGDGHIRDNSSKDDSRAAEPMSNVLTPEMAVSGTEPRPKSERGFENI